MRIIISQPLPSFLADASSSTQSAGVAQSARLIRSANAQKLKLAALASRNKRRGATVVEFAIVGMILITVILGFFEFGRAFWVQEQLTNAARQGARRGLLPNSDSSEVQKVVQDYMEKVGIDKSQVVFEEVTVPATQESTVRVTVSVPYSNVSLLPTPVALTGNVNLRAQVEMRKESNDN
jgi:Flp pilus assembly protein TadG